MISLVIIVYAVILLLVGIWSARHVQSAGDFFVAGRRLSPFWLLITLLAPNIGAGSTLGVAGLAYSYGPIAAIWIASAAIGTIILALFIGPRIWQQARDNNLLTAGDWLEWRYGSRLRSLVSVLLLIGSLALFAGQLLGLAWIISVLTACPKWLGVLAAMLVVCGYFAVGGMAATIQVNLLEIIVKFCGFFAIVAWFCWQNPGRFIIAIDSVQSIGWQMPVSWLCMLIPAFFASPGLIGKIYAANSARTVRKGALCCGIIMFFFAVIPVIIGLEAKVAVPGLGEREMALPALLVQHTPVWLGALALAAIVSAELSAADAVLYMIAGAVARDLSTALLGRALADKQLLRVGRLSGIVAGIIGAVIAIAINNIINALTIFYSLMTIAITAPLLFGLFGRYCREKHALIAVGCGIAVALSGQILDEWLKWPLPAQIFGLLISLLVMLWFRLRKKNDEKIIG